MSQCITGMNHPDSNVKSLGEYGLTGLQASTEGSLEVHGHEFKVTKSAQGVCVCVCVCEFKVTKSAQGVCVCVYACMHTFLQSGDWRTLEGLIIETEQGLC